MSQIAYRANLLSAHFPFMALHHGQTVVIPGRDQAFSQQVTIAGQESEDKDKGIPQLYYAHNVMPIGFGLQSVSFEHRLNPAFNPIAVGTVDRTNLILHSQDQSNAVWTLQEAVITENQFEYPLGTTEMAKLEPTASFNTHWLEQANIAVVSGKRYVVSCLVRYVPPLDHEWICLVGQAGATRYTVSYNLKTKLFGAYQNSPQFGVTYTPDANIARIWLAFYATAALATINIILNEIDVSDAMYWLPTGAGDQVGVSQFQVEQKDEGGPTDYIPTTTVAVTVTDPVYGPGTVIAGTEFDDIFVIRDPDENKYLYSPAGGKNYVFAGDGHAWMSALIKPVLAKYSVSVAYLNGFTYIFFPKDGLYMYNPDCKKFEPRGVIGIDPIRILGVCASNGFLMAWDTVSVYRSKVSDALDFTPDFSLGSGASIPEAIGGQIVCCLPITGGFIIYTTKNAVGATFSKNIKYPFNYEEVQGSAGIQHPRHVAWQNSMGTHFVWTQAGLQKVDKTRAQLIYPEVTDFLTAKIIEDFDPVTDIFTLRVLTTSLFVKVATAGKRFVIISYGENFPYEFALIHDLALKRWGKLKIQHVAAFEYYMPNVRGDVTWADLGTMAWDDFGSTSWSDLASLLSTFEEPKEILALLKTNGEVVTVSFDQGDTLDNSVAILGKYQYVRERFCSLQEIELENVALAAGDFQLSVLTTLDGKNTARKTVPYLRLNSDYYRKYYLDVEGRSHSIVAKGNFTLSSVEMKFKVEGHN